MIKRNFKKEDRIETFKAELKEKYDAYFDSIPSKSKLEEERKSKRKVVKENFVTSPAVFTRHGRVKDASTTKASSLFSGSVEDIIAKLSKMTEKKSNELYISKVTKEAKQALTNIVSEALSAKSPDMKLVSEATSAIKSLSKPSLKEQGDEEKKDKEDSEEEMTDEEKDSEEEDKKKESKKKTESKQLDEAVLAKHTDMLSKVR